MLKRLILAAVIAVLGSGAKADTWSIGYAVVPGAYDYDIEDASSSFDIVRQGREDHSFGTIQILYEHSRPLFDNLFFTLTTGVGLPAGTQKVKESKMYTNVDPSTDSKYYYNDEAGYEFQLTTVPILVGAKYVIPVSIFSFSLGVSVGPVISALHVEETRIEYTGTPPTEVEDYKRVETYTEFVTFFAMMANLGIDYPLSGSDSVGISVPLGFLSEAVGDYDKIHYYNPPAGALSDASWGEELGGFVWGINVGWTKKY